jgi:hypothetical protein
MPATTEGQKWRDLQARMDWQGTIVDLRTFVLQLLCDYTQVNRSAALAALQFYFDVPGEEMPSYRNYHVRFREIAALVYRSLLKSGPEAVRKFYDIPAKEADLIEAIQNG